MSKNKFIKFNNLTPVCVALEKADVERVDAIAKHLGITRSDVFRAGVLKEVILQEGIKNEKYKPNQFGASYHKTAQTVESDARAKIASDILDALYPLRKKANKALGDREFVRPYVRSKKKLKSEQTA